MVFLLVCQDSFSVQYKAARNSVPFKMFEPFIRFCWYLLYESVPSTPVHHVKWLVGVRNSCLCNCTWVTATGIIHSHVSLKDIIAVDYMPVMRLWEVRGDQQLICYGHKFSAMWVPYSFVYSNSNPSLSTDAGESHGMNCENWCSFFLMRWKWVFNCWTNSQEEQRNCVSGVCEGIAYCAISCGRMEWQLKYTPHILPSRSGHCKIYWGFRWWEIVMSKMWFRSRRTQFAASILSYIWRICPSNILVIVRSVWIRSIAQWWGINILLVREVWLI